MLVGAMTLISVIVAAVLCVCTGAFESLVWLWLLPVGFMGSFLASVIVAFLFLWGSTLPIRMDQLQERDDPFYRTMIQEYISAIITLVRLRIIRKGTEQLPKTGRFLLVCNHLNDVDPAILMHVFPKSQLAFISKRENDQKFLIGPLTHKILCQPINRENDREALKTILRCIQIIKEDKASIAVFPEGYTSLDGMLHPFRNGVFKIAQKANVPVVVCTVRNTAQVLPNLPKLKSTTVHVHLLGVISPEEHKGITAVELGNRVHAMMAEDLGPENVL